MARFRHDLGFGADLTADGTRFRFWAPGADHVQLELQDGGVLPMREEGAGWFELTIPVPAGTRYRYRFGEASVPDPASRRQPDGAEGWSEVVDPEAFAWHERAWAGRPWDQAVLYEMHLGTFSAEGTYAGAIAHLDHLVELGVTMIELMPVGTFPGTRNWGYDGVLIFAPDESYGPPEDLKRLVDACHDRGLSIILDVVYNHFGPESNHVPEYAPAFFTDRHCTPWGEAINFDGKSGPAVRDFYVGNALYWLLEYRFDGLRIDAAQAIIDDSDPYFLVEMAHRLRAAVTDRPVHLVLENDNNAAHLLRPDLYSGQWNDDVHHTLRVLVKGETGGYYEDYADRPLWHLGRALTEGFSYQGEESKHRPGLKRGEPSAEVPLPAFISFIQNHDQVGNSAYGKRIAQLAPAEKVRVGVAVVALAPAVPMLFQGEEWATSAPFNFFCDYGPKIAKLVHDGRREEFKRFPEFQSEEALDRIPDACDPATRDAARLPWAECDQSEHRAWLAFYRRVLAVRHAEIVPRLAGMRGGAGRWEEIGPKALALAWTLGDGSTLYLAANFGEDTIGWQLPAGARSLFRIQEDAQGLGGYDVVLGLAPDPAG